MLYSAPLLIYFDISKTILIHVDESPYRIGAVMTPKINYRREKPVCYISHTMSSAGKNYTHTEKEAFVFYVKEKKKRKKFFTLYIDHRTLLKLFPQTKSKPPFAAATEQY